MMKKYLPAHILSIQKQQIDGSLLYRAKLISKESAGLIQEDLNQLDYDAGFLEDHLDRPQASLHSLIEDIRLSDVVEIWELFGITNSHKHYVILLNDGGHLCTCLSIINRGLLCAHFFQVMIVSRNAKFNIGLIAKRWYLEDVQDQDIRQKLQETVGVVTQFQQDNS